MLKRVSRWLDRFYGLHHYYLVVWCKTPHCQTVSPLRYIGADNSVTVSLGNVGFKMTCDKCRTEWLYAVDDIHVVDLKRTPPEAWKDRI